MSGRRSMLKIYSLPNMTTGMQITLSRPKRHFSLRDGESNIVTSKVIPTYEENTTSVLSQPSTLNVLKIHIMFICLEGQ